MSTSISDLAVYRFGEKLRSLRMRHNMNLVQFAYMVGYAGSSHVSQIETGKRGPTVELVLKASKLFNVSADVLLDDDQELAV
jgi:transcriptional regulator with XRE-family HTH domain